jgi:hypothetical protein
MREQLREKVLNFFASLNLAADMPIPRKPFVFRFVPSLNPVERRHLEDILQQLLDEGIISFDEAVSPSHGAFLQFRLTETGETCLYTDEVGERAAHCIARDGHVSGRLVGIEKNGSGPLYIRSEFEEVSKELKTLVTFANAYRENQESWSHYKNQEDFDSVFRMGEPKKGAFNALYGQGRTLGLSLANELLHFNDAMICSTLTEFIDRLAPYEVVLVQQKEFLDSVQEQMGEHEPWSVVHMVKLFKRELDLLGQVVRIVGVLKQSDIARAERGELVKLGLAEKNERVISAIHRYGLRLESLPSTYQGRDEEGIRDLFVSALEVMRPGGAAGEAFRKRGKTDILVTRNGLVELICECKIWNGPKLHQSAIDQLLSYATSRDKELAVLIFSKNKDFTNVLASAHDAAEAHPNHVESAGSVEGHESWQEYTFSNADDTSSQHTVWVLGFNFP